MTLYVNDSGLVYISTLLLYPSISVHDMDNFKRKRCPKTTRQQYMIFLEELENNNAFCCNKFSPEDPNIIENTWEKLTTALNSVGGPQNSTTAWKKIFIDWKSTVRKRARLLKLSATITGGGYPEKALTDLEIKLIEIIGKVTVDGIKGVPEVGLINQTNEQQIATPLEPPSANENVLPSTSSSQVEANPFSVENPTKRKHPFNGEPNETPKHRKNNTLLSSFKTLFGETKENEGNIYNTLSQIDNKLTKLINIKEQKYKLEPLKLKYPDADFSTINN